MAENNVLYGGQQGYSWQIVKSFDNKDAMINAFRDKNYTDVNYGQYCSVDIVDSQGNIIGAEIYRRGYNYEASDGGAIRIMNIPRGYGLTQIEAVTLNDSIAFSDIPSHGQMASDGQYIYICIYPNSNNDSITQEPIQIPNTVFQRGKHIWQCMGSNLMFPLEVTIKTTIPNQTGTDSQNITIPFFDLEFVDAIGQRYIKQINNNEQLIPLSFNSIVDIQKDKDKGMEYALYSSKDYRDNILGNKGELRNYIYTQPDNTEFTFKNLNWKNLGVSGYAHHVIGIYSTIQKAKAVSPASEHNGEIIYIEENKGFYISDGSTWIQIENPTGLDTFIISSEEPTTLPNGGLWFATEQREVMNDE